MKTIFSFLTLFLCLTASPLFAKEHLSKAGDLKIADLGKWQITSDELEENGNAKLKLTLPYRNIYAEIKRIKITPQFDVMMPIFTTQIKDKLKLGGMKIVTSGETTLLGNKAFRVHAVKLVSKPAQEPSITFVVSYSAFIGPEQFITITLAEDKQDLEADSFDWFFPRNRRCTGRTAADQSGDPGD
jgi:hypothetical protein